MSSLGPYILSLLVVCLCASSLQAARLSDPMRPLVGAQVANSPAGQPQQAEARTIRLQSILTGQGRRIAIIDGKALAPGDWYRGAKLLEIQKDRVLMQKANGRKMIIELGAGVAKQSADDRFEKGAK